VDQEKVLGQKVEKDVKDMHPIDLLCKEFEITRYALSKKCGVRESAFSNLVQKNSPVENMRLGTLLKMADGLNLPIGELIEKLLKYENNRLD
jgi:transcriptional regulator with XRE-family HTH domain